MSQQQVNKTTMELAKLQLTQYGENFRWFLQLLTGRPSLAESVMNSSLMVSSAATE